MSQEIPHEQHAEQSKREPAGDMDSLRDTSSIPYQEEVPPLMVLCQRCGLATEDAAHCSHCHAELTTFQKVEAYWEAAQPEKPRVMAVIVAYVLFLMTSLVMAVAIHGAGTISKETSENWLMGIELTDALITFSLFLFVGRLKIRKPRKWKRILTWCLAPLASLAAFGLGHWYVDLLKQYIAFDWFFLHEKEEWSLFNILTTAVQPAIVEELFFRYFCYGALRQVTNAHSAVVLSSLMFALAHLYNPLGLPFLFLMGIMLGYARVYSGGLTLPMLMHFSHNLAILYMESAP